MKAGPRPLAYLDNNATTQPDPRVVDAMLPLLREQYGNASSLHQFGAAVGAQVEQARAHVARLIAARDREIVFTSGGTEANNLALRGTLAARPTRRHVVISAVEHHAILEPAEALRREGVEVSLVGVDSDGRLDLDQLTDAIRDDTAIVSIMLANNETGAIFPIREVADLARKRGAVVHTDGVNALGKIDVNVTALGVDLLSLSAHKIHGPKGCGALYIRRGVSLRPQQLGGPQEQNRRGGTLNAPAIVGQGVACELLAAECAPAREMVRVAALRDRLESALLARVPGAVAIAAAGPRLPNTSCICFPGVASEAVLLLLSETGICASSGAACSSGSLEPSHVLQAMGLDPVLAQGQVRFSLSRMTTDAEVDAVIERLPGILRRVAATAV